MTYIGREKKRVRREKPVPVPKRVVAPVEEPIEVPDWPTTAPVEEPIEVPNWPIPVEVPATF